MPTSRAPRRTYQAIIPFHADNDEQAKLSVMAYAEALGTLRGEIDFFRATVQPADGRAPLDLYCAAPGDDGDFCAAPAGHSGDHHCHLGRRWPAADPTTE